MHPPPPPLFTFPKTNRLPFGKKGTVIFRPPILRGYVVFREGNIMADFYLGCYSYYFANKNFAEIRGHPSFHLPIWVEYVVFTNHFANQNFAEKNIGNCSYQLPSWFRHIQWSFLVPLIGGRYHIIPQLAVYTTYIPLIYCLLGAYMLPTTY